LTDSTALPEPLVPAEVDLRDFSWMPVEIHRLRRSKAWLLCKRKPELAFYMLNLWTASWHDTPAASLEDDDDVLADLAMCDPAKWAKVREQVLRGWVKCADGRLYHQVVADKAKEAWTQKQAQRQRTEAARMAREQKRRQTQQLAQSDAPTDSVATSVTDIATESNRTEQTGQGTERERNGEGTETLPVVGAGPPAAPSAADAAATTGQDRGARLPKDWALPKAWGDWAIAEYPLWTAEKVRKEAAAFRDHWTAKTGKDATKLDWNATWRNWCRSDIAHRDDPKPGRAGPMSDAEREAANAAATAEARRLYLAKRAGGDVIDAVTTVIEDAHPTMEQLT
jgi:hypothetical protein